MKEGFSEIHQVFEKEDQRLLAVQLLIIFLYDHNVLVKYLKNIR